MSEYYTNTGNPAQGAQRSSAPIRNEFDLINSAFNKLPALSGNAYKVIRVNAGGTGLEAVTGLTVEGVRIKADFSNNNFANRVGFQTTEGNKGTMVLAVPNGTNTTTGFLAASDAGVVNFSYVATYIGASGAVIESAAFGAASFLPMSISVGGGSRIDIGTAGHVKIGGTPSVGGADVHYKLQVGAAASGQSGLLLASTGTTQAASVSFRSSNAEWVAGTNYSSTDGRWSLYSVTAGAHRVTVDSSGNVGVNTSAVAPQSMRRFTLGDANAATASLGNMYLYTTDTATAGYGAQITLGGSYSGTTNAPFGYIAGRFTSGLDGYLSLGTLRSGTLTEAMRIDANGNVGVGTTTVTAQLDVRQTADDIPTAKFYMMKNDGGSSSAVEIIDDRGFAGANTGTTLKTLTWVTDGSDTVKLVDIRTTNGTESSKFVIDSNGNVGIGGAATQKLEVAGNIKISSGWLLGTTGTSGYLALATGPNTTSGGALVLRDAASSFNPSGLELYTNSAERLRLDSSGNVTVVSKAGLGYGTGAGATVTQATSRTTSVTINAPVGRITMFTAAGSATPAVFTVNNNTVGVNDVVIINVVGGNANIYNVSISGVAAGSFTVAFYAVGSTSSDTPVLGFAVIKGATS